MFIPPLSVILSWPAPNYEHPVTRGAAILVVNALFTALMVLLLILRLYTRLYISKWFGWDDITLILAVLLTVPQNIIVPLAGLKYGWNRHIWDIPLNLIPISSKFIYVETVLFPLAAIITESSLMILYSRLNEVADIKWFRSVLIVAAIWLTLSWAPLYFLSVIPCLPVRQYWTIQKIPGAKCTNQRLIIMTGSVLKTVNNIVIVTVPIPLTLRLNMSRAHKIAAVVLLGVGYLVSAVGFVRVYYTWKALYGNSDGDLTWWNYVAVLAGVVENNMAVICACIPALRPIVEPILSTVKTFVQTFAISRSGSSANQSNSNQSNSKSSFGKKSSGAEMSFGDSISSSN